MEPRRYFFISLALIIAILVLGSADAFGASTITYEESPYATEVYRASDFSDLGGHWARTPIYRMAAQSVIKGDGQGKFRPEASLTREEALALIIRIAGHEEEAQIAAEVQAQNQPAPITQEQESPVQRPTAENFWASGYIQIAANRGIITPGEQADLDATKNKNAQRQEVAAWLAKALELPSIYGTKQQLVYSFSDWRQFNPELLSAIEPILQSNIMSGDPDGRFRPTATIKRGEMAALLDRVNKQGLDQRGWGSLEGQILGKSSRWEAAGAKGGNWFDLEVQLTGYDRALVAYRAPGGFPVLENNNLTRASSLAVGQRVEFIFNPNKEIVFAQVLPSRQGSFDGYFGGLSRDQKSLQLRDPYSQQNRSIPISAQVTVIMDGRPASLQDLLVGQEIRLGISNNTVVKIDATLGPSLVGYEPPTRPTVKMGRIKEVWGELLTIVVDSQEETYRLSSTTRFIRGSQPIKAIDLRIGDRVRLEVVDPGNAQVSKVEVSAYEGLADKVVRGRLNAVYPEGRKVSLVDPQEYFYGRWYPVGTLGAVELDGGAEIYLGNQLVSLEELRRGHLGHEVFIALSSTPGKLLGSKMLVREGEPRPYNGLIDQVAWALNRFSLIKQEASFLVDEGTIAIRDGKLVSPQDFKADEHVFLETIYAGDGGYSALMQYFQGVPPGLKVYAGRLDKIERRSLEIQRGSQLVRNEWEDLPTRRTPNLTFDNRTRIWDAWDRADWITPDELAESRWSEEYRRNDSFIITDKDHKVLAMAIRRRNPATLKTSVARVVEVERERTYLKLDRVQDWSGGYQRWTPNPDPLRLYIEDALIFKGSSIGSLGDLKPGDVVYVVHDQDEGCIIFTQ